MGTQSGITLIALIITIIVMLILAGVALTALTEQGLFNQSVNATESYRNAQVEENTTLNDYQDKLNYYTNVYQNSIN